MKQFMASVFPSSIFATKAHYAKFALAIWTIAILVLQLFAFEKLPSIFDLYVGQGNGAIEAILIVVVEVLSLPYLLSMPLSAGLSRRSKFFSLITPCLWLLLCAMAWFAGQSVGLFGAKFHVIPVAGLLLCAVWLVGAVCCTRQLSVNKKSTLYRQLL